MTTEGPNHVGDTPSDRFLDPAVVAKWADHDPYGTFLELPRALVAYHLAAVAPPQVIADIGAGDGKFLTTMLQHFPTARGVWVDHSPAMAELASHRLEPFRERIAMLEGNAFDASVVAALAKQHVDTVITSRMTHMFLDGALDSWYGSLTDELPELVTIANIDHVGGDQSWFDAMFAARSALIEQRPANPNHWQRASMATEADHKHALSARGFQFTKLWQAFYTVGFNAIRTKSTA
jgi:trans-aconitate methyltransferase